MESKIISLYLTINRQVNSRRLTYAWIAGIAMWTAWALSVLLGPGNLDLTGNVVGTDYIQFYAAGASLKLGESGQLYDFAYQKSLQAEIAGPPFDHFHAFITPPFLAWLYLPFSYLPYGLSFLLWSLLGLGWLWRSLKWLQPASSAKTFLYSLTWFPVFTTISFGQNSLLSLFLMTLIYVCWSKGKLLEAGLSSAFLLYKPQLVLGLLVLWLVRWKKDRMALVGLLLGGCLLAAASILLMPQASKDYLIVLREVVPSIDSWEGFPHWHSYTLRTFWLLGLPDQRSLAEAITLIFTLLGVVAFIRFARQIAEQAELVFAGAVCLTAVIAPHNMVYDWTILLVPAVLLWRYLPEERELLRGVYVTVWLAALVSGVLTKAQLTVLPVAVQVALPVLVVGLWVLGRRVLVVEGEGEREG